LQKKQHLSEIQYNQFYHYLSLLLTVRTQFNLTAISSPIDTIDFHFNDSLALTHCIDLKSVSMFADIGTGGGFPGIPLKIYFPHLSVILLEVNQKKVDFLNKVINELQLEKIKVIDKDWRTFLRKEEYPIDLFLSRASLHTDELIRMFQPSCYYNSAMLVYWASAYWQLMPLEEPFFLKECPYSIQNKKRRLIFFKRKNSL
jgi:16S rRNA (guanine527-N7)-methyltransferase